MRREHFLESRLINYGNAELLGLLQLRARGAARNHKIRFL